jgi:hypothetical protein
MNSSDTEAALNRQAEDYVQLVLALGQHDADYVDAYYGPPAWKDTVERERPTLEAIAAGAESLAEQLALADVCTEPELLQLRHSYLLRQTQALGARASMLRGTRFSFDEESRALYDAVAPTYPEKYFQDLLKDIAALLPGSGPVHERYEEFRKDFVIPPERLDAVFAAAIQEGRNRTRRHLVLPPEESFTVEYVRGKSWSGYNWYRGSAASLIQVNTDFPISIDRAVDLAFHEGYPGHHVYNTLLEYTLVRGHGWLEFTVYPLFSPQSLIAEGTANFGIEVALPGDERVAFERDVLFPQAGLDTSRAEEFYKLYGLVMRLNYAGNEAARRYCNGDMSREDAVAWLVTYALMPPDRAMQRTRFFDAYRSYVINYNLGQDLVQEYVEARGGTPGNPERRWEIFAGLLASPQLPSALRTPARS